MAVAAGEILRLVGRAEPMKTRAAGVALQTHRVLLRYRVVGAAREGHDQCPVAGVAHMLFARSVAGLAAAFFQSIAGMVFERLRMHGVIPVLGFEPMAETASRLTEELRGRFRNLVVRQCAGAQQYRDRDNHQCAAKILTRGHTPSSSIRHRVLWRAMLL